MKETLAEDHLKVNEHKTEETIINKLKDKNNEEWRKTKKLGSLHSLPPFKRKTKCKEDSFGYCRR